MNSTPYKLPSELPWPVFAAQFERAENALARLDERLRNNPLAEGWTERTHFAEACAALWNQGELVHLEDLVLRDAGMDVRSPTHATNRAMSVLRARRLVARRGGEWALSTEALNVLRGRALAQPERHSELVYDMDWDEDACLAEWRRVLEGTTRLPGLLAAAVAFGAWCRIEPLQQNGWLGSVLVAGLLQRRGKTRHHLTAINAGLRAARYRPTQVDDLGQRLAGFLDGVTAAAELGRKDLDRLSLAQEMMSMKSRGRRSNSRLPRMIDLVLSKPLVSVPLAAKQLKVSSQAVEAMISELGSLRELTGRARYRAWAVV